MRPFLLLSLLLLVSACGARKSSSYKMGETTRADIIVEKGEALAEVAIPVPGSTVASYPNNEKFQYKGDVVVNHFTDPAGDEKLVQWWKHKFKDCLTQEKKLPKDPNSHTPGEIELSCPAEGLSIIYTEGASAVSRVVEFEK